MPSLPHVDKDKGGDMKKHNPTVGLQKVYSRLFRLDLFPISPA